MAQFIGTLKSKDSLPPRAVHYRILISTSLFRRTTSRLSEFGSWRGGCLRIGMGQERSTLPLANVCSMEDVMSAAQSRPRFLTLLLTLFSSVALILAAVGIYGVISYSVAQRTREFGVRIALGAQPADLLGIVLRRGMLLAGIGVLTGLAGAFWLTRFLMSLLFGVTPTDPVTFGTIPLLLVGVALLASYIPARPATKIDPIVALRYA